MMRTIISVYTTTNKFTEEYNLHYMIKKFNLIDCNLNNNDDEKYYYDADDERIINE